MRSKLSSLQNQIMFIMSNAQCIAQTGTEIGKALGVYPGRLAGPLGGLRKRKLLGVSNMPVAPLRMVVNPRDWHGDGYMFINKPHYFVAGNLEHMKSFKRLRQGCASMYRQRFRELTYNQQLQAVEGSWDV